MIQSQFNSLPIVITQFPKMLLMYCCKIHCLLLLAELLYEDIQCLTMHHALKTYGGMEV